MNWLPLTSADQLNQIKSAAGYSIIFKHSTRCPISSMAKRKVELDWDSLPSDTPLYYLDLIAYREVSALVAEVFRVHHESPQLLLIKDGECVYESSHGDISIDETMDQMAG